MKTKVSEREACILPRLFAFLTSALMKGWCDIWKNKYKEIALKTLLKEINKAEKMVAYTMEFEDKTAVGRWKMTVFQLKCLYKKLDTAFKLIQEGCSDEKVEDLLDILDKKLFMEGP